VDYCSPCYVSHIVKFDFSILFYFIANI
jgi:hypothetical protein